MGSWGIPIVVNLLIGRGIASKCFGDAKTSMSAYYAGSWFASFVASCWLCRASLQLIVLPLVEPMTTLRKSMLDVGRRAHDDVLTEQADLGRLTKNALTQKCDVRASWLRYLLIFPGV